MPHRAVRDPDRLHELLDAVLAVDTDVDLRGVLQGLVEGACRLTGARYGALGVLDPSGTHLQEFVTAGVDEAVVAATGGLPDGRGVLGLLVVDPRPLRLDDLRAHPDATGFPPGHPTMRTFLGVPVRVGGSVFGNLYLTDKQPPAPGDAPRAPGAGPTGDGATAGGVPVLPFTEEDEALVLALASAAASAVGKARLLAQVAELTRVAERERVARDLHDTVIQRLFAAGLQVEACLPLVADDDVRRNLAEAVAQLDDTIVQVRSTVFDLSEPDRPLAGVRARVLDTCAEAATRLGADPEVSFRGPVDAVPAPLAGELLVVLRRALAAEAGGRGGVVAVDVAVHPAAEAGTRRLRLQVADGGGSGPGARGGWDTLARRAVDLGGRLQAGPADHGGSVLVWEVPLPAGSAGG